MSVDTVQLAVQSDGKLHHVPDLGLLPLPVLKQHVCQRRAQPQECVGWGGVRRVERMMQSDPGVTRGWSWSYST